MAVKEGSKRSTGKARTRAQRAAKSGASKPTEAKKASTNGGKRAATRERDAKIMEQVVEMRGNGKSWGDIAKKLSLTSGKAQFLAMVNAVKPKDRVKKGTDAEVGKAIVALRKQDLSWGQIAARTYHLGIPEARVKALAQAADKTLVGGNVAQKRAGQKARAKAARTSGRKTSGRKASGNPSK